ncbi:helix-turn-helix domain-containing protein [Kitasatospora sp. NPDC058046]|uniref:helix-turn-helix domain-containing protein n=1 Tax=Kitasatospora sp. NPDC058046 TaxID=3346312 RepID=UPI0036DBE1A5
MDTDNDVAVRFGALVTRLAAQRGYDVTPGTGDRAKLADRIGMSRSTFGRMLDGKTLPLPAHFERIAKGLGVDVRDLLVEGRVISEESWPKGDNSDVRSLSSQSPLLTPDAAADAWGITDPMIRSMLVSNIEQAIQLQQRANRPDSATGG